MVYAGFVHFQEWLTPAFVFVGAERCVYLGTTSTEALKAYSAPKGGNMQAMAGGARFEDLSYDGLMRDNMMQDGLGQITDSLTGPNDFELLDTSDTRG